MIRRSAVEAIRRNREGGVDLYVSERRWHLHNDLDDVFDAVEGKYGVPLVSSAPTVT